VKALALRAAFSFADFGLEEHHTADPNSESPARWDENAAAALITTQADERHRLSCRMPTRRSQSWSLKR